MPDSAVSIVAALRGNLIDGLTQLGKGFDTVVDKGQDLQKVRLDPDLEQQLLDIAQGAEDAAASLGTMGTELEKTDTALGDLQADSLNQIEEALKQNTEAAQFFREETERVAEEVDRLSDAQRAGEKSARDAAGTVTRFTGVLKGQAGAAQEAGVATKVLTSASTILDRTLKSLSRAIFIAPLVGLLVGAASAVGQLLVDALGLEDAFARGASAASKLKDSLAEAAASAHDLDVATELAVRRGATDEVTRDLQRRIELLDGLSKSLLAAADAGEKSADVTPSLLLGAPVSAEGVKTGKAPIADLLAGAEAERSRLEGVVAERQKAADAREAEAKAREDDAKKEADDAKALISEREKSNEQALAALDAQHEARVKAREDVEAAIVALEKETAAILAQSEATETLATESADLAKARQTLAGDDSAEATQLLLQLQGAAADRDAAKKVALDKELAKDQAAFLDGLREQVRLGTLTAEQRQTEELIAQRINELREKGLSLQEATLLVEKDRADIAKLVADLEFQRTFEPSGPQLPAPGAQTVADQGAIAGVKQGVDELNTSLGTTQEQFAGITKTAVSGFADGLVDGIVRADTSLGDFARNFTASLAIMIAKAAALKLTLQGLQAIGITALASDGGVVASKGGLLRFEGGGPVPGIDTGVDKVPALLRPREFVEPPETVDFYGAGLFESLRRRLIPRSFFAGMVHPSPRIVGTGRFAEGGQAGLGGRSGELTRAAVVGGEQAFDRLSSGGEQAFLRFFSSHRDQIRTRLGV